MRDAIPGQTAALHQRTPRCALALALLCATAAPAMALAQDDAEPPAVTQLAEPAILATEPAAVAKHLREATDGLTGGQGLLRAAQAAEQLVARAPAAVMLASEALRDLSRELGFRPDDAARLIEDAGAASPWLAGLIRVGWSFQLDRSLFLSANTAIEDDEFTEDRLAAAHIVRTRTLIAMDRNDDALDALANIEYQRGEALDPWALDARLRLLGLLGEDANLLALALRTLPAEQPAAGDATIAERLALAGEAAVRLNNRALALGLLSAARDLQPERLSRHERVVQLLLEEPGAVQRVSLRSPLGRALRDLRRHHPGAAMLELVMVREAVRRDQPALVVRSLEQLAERFPEDDVIRGELVARWLDLREIERARTTIDARLEATPAPARAFDMVLYGRILAAEQLPDRAIQRLGTWIDEQGDDPRVLLELERLYRTGVFDNEQAERMKLRRLDALPPTIANAIERATAEASAREWSVAVESLRSAFARMSPIELETPARNWLPDLPQRLEPTLRDDQRQQAVDVIRVVMDDAIDELPAAEVVALFDAGARALAPMPDDLAQYWVSRVLISGAGLERAIAAAETAGADSRETRRSVFTMLLRELGQGGRMTNAFVTQLRNDPRSLMTVARRGALGGGGNDPEMFTQWLLRGYIVTTQRPRDERLPDLRQGLAEAVDQAHQAGLLREAVAGASGSSNGLSPADLCEVLVRTVDPDHHWDEAVLLYRLGLTFDPTHASLNNSYGYRLLERDEDIERAEAMIQRAVSAEPNEPAYLDSLGWARYKLGILQDEPRVGPLGEPKEGAITLLERAIELIGPVEDPEPTDGEAVNALLNLPTILDHAGDAHWAAGNRDTAIERWQAAARQTAAIEAWIERRNLDTVMDTLWLTRELKRVASSTAEKLAAASADEPVPIARIHERPTNGPAQPDTGASSTPFEGPGG